MKRVIFACLVFAYCPAVYAEGPSADVPAARAGATSPPALAPTGERLGHLLIAAENLEAAGMPDVARTVREQAEGEKRALLARIDALERELERLRQLVRGSQVLVHVRMVEVSRSKLRKLGFDFSTVVSGPVELASGDLAGSQPFQFGVVDDGDPALALLDALRKDGLSRVLAEPTLVTVSGRPAHVNVGGEVPAPVRQPDGTLAIEFREYGTRIDLVPIVLGKGRMRLEVRVRVSEIDPSRTVEVEGQKCPSLMVREVDTGVEMNAGQTLILGGLVQDRRVEPAAEAPRKRHASPTEAVAEKTDAMSEVCEETELWVVVQPEIVEPMAPRGLGAQPAPPLPSAIPPAVAAEPWRPAEAKRK